ADEDEAPVKKGKGDPRTTTKAGAKGTKGAPGKGGKGGKDDPDRPGKKAAGGSSKTVILGVGLAVVGRAAIGIAIAVAMSGKKPEKPASTNTGASSSNTGGTTDPPKTDTPAPKAEPPVVPDITNLLPNDTQAVVSLPINRALGSALKTAALDSDG